MKKISKISLAVVLAVALSLCLAGSASAASPARVYLRTADHFAILSGAAITDNTGTFTNQSAIAAGDVGAYPIDGAAIGLLIAQIASPGVIYDRDGAYPITDSRVITADALLLQAKNDLTTAYNDAAGRPANLDLSTIDLGGLTLTPGVYKFTSSAQLTGILTLDSAGESDPVWIIQTGTTLTTASGSSVVFTNTGTGGRLGTPCDVFWQIGSSATLGTTTSFVGNIMADQAITMDTDATLLGTAQTRIAAVTLDRNTITKGPCALAPPATPIDTGMPYTGNGPDANTIRWSIALLAAAILAGIFGVSFVLRVYRRKKVTS